MKKKSDDARRHLEFTSSGINFGQSAHFGQWLPYILAKFYVCVSVQWAFKTTVRGESLYLAPQNMLTRN